MLNWADQFNIFCFLDNCNYTPESSWEWMAAIGSRDILYLQKDGAFASIDAFRKKNNEWLFGHFSYDLKNQVEELSSSFPDETGFGIGCLFVPAVLLRFGAGKLSVSSPEQPHSEIFNAIQSMELNGRKSAVDLSSLHTIPNKQNYLETIAKVKDHIQAGDCYEINICRQHLLNGCIDPLATYFELLQASPVPFAALYKQEENYCISASPERYIKKTGSEIISQPIKGTAKRFTKDSAADEASKQTLFTSEKEKSENVMIVDLVRNDLGRVCVPGSVRVSELFGIYSFPQVHQMISTIRGELRDEVSFTDILKATFPMGSMTGAPKKKVMELIDAYEPFNRGLFSGTIGYIDPNGDFDFNVVIRSIFYNRTLEKLAYFAGGAITINSDAAAEWEECNLKTSAIRKALGIGAND